eukprot:CAMPEP_0171073264 /NCGR_PEP_ID=MMETSP0766_2-20121228/11395_1 /TAXON_ID=439317 /ORGANISM="Gambierdiscus australes, Strain CAWD 149" /LENGTH=277 /DNA_ID=CAMNT_0011529937 /DNA_START=78 /DNA_END=911 /DNA_ORIENTATION=+
MASAPGLCTLLACAWFLCSFCVRALPHGVVLLQSSTASARRQSPVSYKGPIGTELFKRFFIKRLEEAATDSDALALPQFDCPNHPYFCEAPFNCHTLTHRKVLQWTREGIGGRGPDPQAVCSFLHNEMYLGECLVKHDPVRAAHLQHLLTREGLKGQGDFEGDASYCFLEGLCSESNITATSTAEDGAAVCDSRYGRERWARFGSATAAANESINANGHGSALFGLHSRLQSVPLALSACACGTFHCEVMLCQETYCRDRHAMKKFGYHLRAFHHIP